MRRMVFGLGGFSGRGIGRRDRLAAGGLQRDDERMRAVVGRGERVAGRQTGLGVGTAQVDRAGIRREEIAARIADEWTV